MKHDISYFNDQISIALSDARVVLSLANFDEFAKTYNCPVNSRMNPKDKCIT